MIFVLFINHKTLQETNNLYKLNIIIFFLSNQIQSTFFNPDKSMLIFVHVNIVIAVFYHD